MSFLPPKQQRQSTEGIPALSGMDIVAATMFDYPITQNLSFVIVTHGHFNSYAKL